MNEINIKKIEKISHAIYLISNHLKDNEPIKWELRKQSLSFIENARSIDEYDIRGIPRDICIEMFVSCSKDIITLFHLSANSNLISRANSDLIINEIEIVYSSIDKNAPDNNVKAGFVLSRDFFATDHISIDNHTKKGISGISTDKSINKAIDKDNNVKDKKNDRQSRILSMLKNQSNMTIKDFVKAINDCSEKTIQRELLTLVEKGIVKKEGERRWSKYSLK